MNVVKHSRSRRSGRKLRRNLAIVLIGLVTLIAGSTALGQYIAQSVKVNMAFTDDIIASVYVLALSSVYLLVSYVMPIKARRH